MFANFDPVAVSKFNEKKIIAPGSTAASLLSELKLRAIIENARQISKVDSYFLLALFHLKQQKMHVCGSLKIMLIFHGEYKGRLYLNMYNFISHF